MEEILPGTRPTLRRLVVDAARELPKDKEGYVHLKDIRIYVKSKLTQHGVDFTHVLDIDAHIRRQIYADLVGGPVAYNRGYFERKSLYSGLFRLTNAGLNFKGR